MKTLVLGLMVSVALISDVNAQDNKALDFVQGDICSFQATEVKAYGGTGFASVGLSFVNEELLNFEIPLSSEDYQILFINQVYHAAYGFLSMEHPNAYKIYYDYTDAPSEQNLRMLTINLEFSYDNSGHLTEAKALYKENWGFPESIWKNEYKEATCQF